VVLIGSFRAPITNWDDTKSHFLSLIWFVGIRRNPDVGRIIAGMFCPSLPQAADWVRWVHPLIGHAIAAHAYRSLHATKPMLHSSNLSRPRVAA